MTRHSSKQSKAKSAISRLGTLGFESSRLPQDATTVRQVEFGGQRGTRRELFGGLQTTSADLFRSAVFIGVLLSVAVESQWKFLRFLNASV